MMRFLSRMLPVFLLLFVAGCAGGLRMPEDIFAPDARTGVRTYYGELPCAECRVQQLTLTLFDNGTFRLNRVYSGQRNGRDRVEADLGRWKQDGERIVLQGSSDFPLQFRRVSASELKLLDQMGHEIVSRLDYSVFLTSIPDFLPGPYLVQGMYCERGGNAYFRECRTGLEYRLVFENPDPSVSRKYAALVTSPGAEVMAALRARFMLRRDSGSGSDNLMVRKFISFLPGGSCAP